MSHQSPAAREPPDEAVVSAFLDQARYLAEGEWRRAEGFQHKAGLLLAGSGVILALVAGWLDGSAPWWVLAPGLVAVAALLACAAAAMVVLWPREITFASHDQLRKQWADYTDARSLLPWQVTGLAVSNLVLPDGQRKSSLATLKIDATERAFWFKCSVLCFLTGLLGVVVFASVIIVRGGLNA